MAIKSFKRFERKFIINSTQYNSLILKLKDYMVLDKYCKNNNNYNIYTIYFDTKNNDVIRHSISKPYYKEKLRLRSYKDSISLDDKVFLELKKKVNGIVNKRRIVITLKEAYDFLENGIYPGAPDNTSKQVIKEIDYYLKNNEISPSVYIGYTRHAFFGKDNPGFRITFDSNIISRRKDLYLESECSGINILDKDKYLMEVKFIGAIPLWFTKILSELKIYNTHFSKYGNEYINYSLENTNDRRNKIC